MATKGSVAKFIDPNARVRKLGNDVVKPCLYNGHAVGFGKYFAGEVNGKLVLDKFGKPVPFSQTGELVYINR